MLRSIPLILVQCTLLLLSDYAAAFFLPAVRTKQKCNTICWAQNQERAPRRQAPNQRASLKWVVQSIQRNDDNPGPPPSPELLGALKVLDKAYSQREVLEFGRQLDGMSIAEKEGVFVQERLIKITAIAGLLSTSSDIMDGLLKKGHVPSDIAYTALFKALRQSRRLKQLEDMLKRLAENTDSSSINVVAFNTYLAALCDSVTKRDATRRRNLKMEDISQLEKARKLLNPAKAQKCFRAEPDESSYSTVLHAAASVGNRDMVNEVWREMKQEGINPNRYAFNALMKAICNEGPDFDDEAMHLLGKMRRNPFLQPDQYTIDLVLLPMMRTEGIDGVCELMGDFTSSYKSQYKVQERAFSSFLNTLVKAGEIEAATVVFDEFLLPRIDDPMYKKTRFPGVRHFNILLTGLRRAISKQKSHLDKQEIRQQSTTLYKTMVKGKVHPDEYTLTILMGMVNDNHDVIRLLRTAVVETRVNMSPEVLRATLAAFGESNDPSSACWLFDSWREEIFDKKTWNAMIGALASSAAVDGYNKLRIESSEAAGALSQDFDVAGQAASSQTLSSLVEGRTCQDAVMIILDAMNQNIKDIKAPAPNTQTYCLVASALQHGPSDSKVAIKLFQNAMEAKIPADGRFVNAVLRCFGSDIKGALEAWKGTMRQSCLEAEQRATSTSRRSTSRNLLAAYQGLLYVCGRALRPDIALRIVYAMNKENVDVNEMALQCFQAGKRKTLSGADADTAPTRKAVAFGNQFESLLQVECTKYVLNDKRREGDKRVRIIL